MKLFALGVSGRGEAGMTFLSFPPGKKLDMKLAIVDVDAGESEREGEMLISSRREMMPEAQGCPMQATADRGLALKDVKSVEKKMRRTWERSERPKSCHRHQQEGCKEKGKVGSARDCDAGAQVQSASADAGVRYGTYWQGTLGTGRYLT